MVVPNCYNNNNNSNNIIEDCIRDGTIIEIIDEENENENENNPGGQRQRNRISRTRTRHRHRQQGGGRQQHQSYQYHQQLWIIRLIIRPMVVLLFGFYLFRNPAINNRDSRNPGSFSFSFDNVRQSIDRGGGGEGGIDQNNLNSNNNERKNNEMNKYSKEIVSTTTTTTAAKESSSQVLRSSKKDGNYSNKNSNSNNNNFSNIVEFDEKATGSFFPFVNTDKPDNDNEDDDNSTTKIEDATNTKNNDEDKDNSGVTPADPADPADPAGTAAASTNNPDMYGWEPTLYPEPMIDPILCGIAYLTVEELESNHNIEATGKEAEDERRGGGAASSNVTTDIDNNNNNIPGGRLRLCDPDWVLGGIYLEKIAKKMEQFSNTFSSSNSKISSGSSTSGSGSGSGSDSSGSGSDSRSSNGSDLDEDLDGNAVAVNYQPQQNHGGGSSIIVQKQQQQPGISLAVATVRKMNIQAVLKHEQSFYAYEDEDDMVNDAARIFAEELYNQWWNKKGDDDDNAEGKTVGIQANSHNSNEDIFYRGRWHTTNTTTTKKKKKNKNNMNRGDYGVLIFLSVQDRVCFISTGNAISSILPWWRIEHIISSMKPNLRHGQYGDSVLTAIDDLSKMLIAGPPTPADRLHDFMARFGVVIAFALLTFLFGAWGEYRDRCKRYKYVESRSQLSTVEREKARLKQKKYQTKSCPICLESFGYNSENENHDDITVFNSDDDVANAYANTTTDADINTKITEVGGGKKASSLSLPRVDSYGIPLVGADRKKIKYLRCGHIFCESCWKNWVHSGHGNPCICPVCRQDVGKSSSKNKRRKQEQRRRRQAALVVAGVAETTEREDEEVVRLPSLDHGNNIEQRQHDHDGLEGFQHHQHDDPLHFLPTYGSLSTSTSAPLVTDNNNNANNSDSNSGFLSQGANLWSFFAGGGSDSSSNPSSEVYDTLEEEDDEEAVEEVEEYGTNTVSEVSTLLHNDYEQEPEDQQRTWFPSISGQQF